MFRYSSTARWAVLLGLLAVLSAWTVACQGADTPNATSDPVASTSAVATPTSSATLTPSPIATPTPSPTTNRAPVATARPAATRPHTPGIIGGQHPSYTCGPTWPERFRDIHQHFLHWTKDGLHLIFDSSEAIWIVDAAGTQVRQIVDPDPGRGSHGTLESGYGFYADVSPDSTRIVYSTCEFPLDDSSPYQRNDVNPRALLGYEIAVVNIDGTSQRRLTNNAYLEHYPVWSPDGSKIAYLASPNTSHGGYHPGTQHCISDL